MFPTRAFQNFAADSGLNENCLKELMYPPRPQRNARNQKEVFIPPSSTSPQIDEIQNSKPFPSVLFKINKKTQKRSKTKNQN